MCPESLALGPGNKLTDVKNCHNYNSWFLHLFDDSIDALFMCITLLLPVVPVPRFLLCKEQVNYRQDNKS